MFFSSSEFSNRLEKTKKSMIKNHVEILIVTDPSNMNYLTGYDGWSFYVPQGVIVSLDLKEPIWFGRKQDANGAKITTYINHDNIIGYPEELIQSPPTHPYDYVAKIIQERNWLKKSIGVEMDSYYYSAECHARLLKHLPNTTFKDSTLLVNWVRFVKSNNEIEYMKQAGVLVQAGMKTAYEKIRPGIRQCDVAAEIQHSLISGTEKFGGEYSGLTIILASGISASASHLTPKDRKFINNEGTIIELAGVKHRYHCPLSRTVYLGKPDQQTIDTMAITNEGVEAAIEKVKPGNTAYDIAQSFWDVLSKYGLKKDSRLGYSTGIGYPPDWGEHTMSIRLKDKTILKPNVTFHMIAGMWMDTWGLEVSETIRVTEKSCEPLSNFSRNLFTI
jgi:ectoine utilization protein EutD